jgi:hypothetical protein
MKEEGGRRKEEGGRRKEDGGRRKEEQRAKPKRRREERKWKGIGHAIFLTDEAKLKHKKNRKYKNEINKNYF